MIKHLLIVSTIFLLAACSNPKNITFGINPSEDLIKHSEELKKLPPEDLEALTAYVTYAEKNTAAGKANPVIGKKVSDILPDAKSWQKVQQTDAEQKRRIAEEQRAAESKKMGEYKLTMERFFATVKVSFLKRTVIPPQVEVVNRPEPIVKLEYEVENRGSKPISALKGHMRFADLFGKVILEHPFQTDKSIPIAAKMTFTVYYKVFPTWREIVSFANFEDGKFTSSFIPEAVSYEGGETLDLTPPQPSASAVPAAGSLPPLAPPAPTTPTNVKDDGIPAILK